MSEIQFPQGLSNRTPFVSTVRSMKPPDKPALIDSHDNEFRAILIYRLTKPLLQRRGRGVDHSLRSGSRRLWPPDIPS